VGDVLVAINGTPIERRYDVRRLLNRRAIGTVCSVDIVRNGKTRSLTVGITPRDY
jgi:S1-C subfamily serine protease